MAGRRNLGGPGGGQMNQRNRRDNTFNPRRSQVDLRGDSEMPFKCIGCRAPCRLDDYACKSCFPNYIRDPVTRKLMKKSLNGKGGRKTEDISTRIKSRSKTFERAGEYKFVQRSDRHAPDRNLSRNRRAQSRGDHDLMINPSIQPLLSLDYNDPSANIGQFESFQEPFPGGDDSNVLAAAQFIESARNEFAQALLAEDPFANPDNALEMANAAILEIAAIAVPSMSAPVEDLFPQFDRDLQGNQTIPGPEPLDSDASFGVPNSYNNRGSRTKYPAHAELGRSEIPPLLDATEERDALNRERQARFSEKDELFSYGQQRDDQFRNDNGDDEFGRESGYSKLLDPIEEREILVHKGQAWSPQNTKRSFPMQRNFQFESDNAKHAYGNELLSPGNFESENRQEVFVRKGHAQTPERADGGGPRSLKDPFRNEQSRPDNRNEIDNQRRSFNSVSGGNRQRTRELSPPVKRRKQSRDRYSDMQYETSRRGGSPFRNPNRERDSMNAQEIGRHPSFQSPATGHYEKHESISRKGGVPLSPGEIFATFVGNRGEGDARRVCRSDEDIQRTGFQSSDKRFSNNPRPIPDSFSFPPIKAVSEHRGAVSSKVMSGGNTSPKTRQNFPDLIEEPAHLRQQHDLNEFGNVPRGRLATGQNNAYGEVLNDGGSNSTVRGTTFQQGMRDIRPNTGRELSQQSLPERQFELTRHNSNRFEEQTREARRNTIGQLRENECSTTFVMRSDHFQASTLTTTSVKAAEYSRSRYAQKLEKESHTPPLHTRPISAPTDGLINKSRDNVKGHSRQNGPLRFVFDMRRVCALSNYAAEDAIKGLSLLYQKNLTATSPLHLYFMNFPIGCPLDRHMLNISFDKWDVEQSADDLFSYFSKDELVYISPHASTVLVSPNHSKVYVVNANYPADAQGGRESFEIAKSLGIETARLPILDVSDSECPLRNTIIPSAYTGLILLQYLETEYWKTSIILDYPGVQYQPKVGFKPN